MTTYNQIAGRRVNFLSSDPTYVDTNSDGQVWYNSSTATLKSWLPTGAWVSGGNLNTARQGLAGAGTQTAAIAMAGYVNASPGVTNSELYNGIAWTNGNSLNTSRFNLASGGTQTATLAYGGTNGSKLSSTELFNGTSWTNNPTGLNTARSNLFLNVGLQTASLAFGGQAAPGITGATESFNGSTWTTSPASLNTPRWQHSGFGTQTAAIAVAGGTPSTTGATESYNGSAWTTVNSLNTGRTGMFAFGTQTAGIGSGGYNPSPSLTNITESWNGTSWTNSTATMATTRGYGSSGGTQTSGVIFGGAAPPNSVATEEWNFGVYSYSAAAWASGGNLPTATNLLFGFGTQTATLAAAGNIAPGNSTATYLYNGTSWTTSPATVGTGRYGGGSASASPQTAGLIFAGYPTGPA